jgi:hypothetical protein
MPKSDSKLKYSKRPSKKSGKAVAAAGAGAKGGEPFRSHLRVPCLDSVRAVIAIRQNSVMKTLQ